MASIPLIMEEDVERGGKDCEGGIEDDFAYRNNVLNATQAVRMGFIRKVYGLLTIQLFMTVLVAGVCMLTPPIKSFIHTNDWLMIVAFIASIVLLIALHIKRKESPTNLILLAGFTIVQAYTIGVLVTFYSQAIVVQALVLTLAVLGGLTMFTFQTKKDFSMMGSGLFAGLCILLVGGILQMFMRSTGFELILCFGGAFVFCLFILYDTQMMMKHLSPEEYILATINLYMDIINLFIYILRILQAASRQ